MYVSFEINNEIIEPKSKAYKQAEKFMETLSKDISIVVIEKELDKEQKNLKKLQDKVVGLEDKNKKLWFGSYGEGLSIFDGFRFKVISEEEGLVHNEITELFTLGNQMFVGTSDGVSIIDINTYKVISLDLPLEEKLFRVQDFFEYRGQVYVATYNSGIYRIQNKNSRCWLK